MNRALLSIFLCLFFVNVGFSSTITFIGASTNATTKDWNTAANWSSNTVPTSDDDVLIPSGKTVIITADSFAKTVSVTGALYQNDGVSLTVSGNFIVNSGGIFDMSNENGSGSIAALLVYGNYSNNGTTQFWKGIVIIAGNLSSNTTSTIQNNGNVVVGGDIIGVFDTTGGTGSGQIYAVDPNATVTITPTSIDNNVNPGVAPQTPTESQALIDLVNTVIYGGACSFTVNDVVSQSVCSGNSAVFAVTTGASSPTYQWQVNSGSGWIDLTGQTTASLILTSVTVGMSGNKYRAKITSSSCTKSGNYGVLTVNPASVGGIVAGSVAICSGTNSTTLTLSGHAGTITRWESSLDNFATAGTSIANTTTTLTVTNLIATTYYRAVVANGSCASANSSTATITVSDLPNNISNGFSATTICSGGSPQLTFDADDTTFSTPYSITYKNNATSTQYTVSIPSASPYSFTPGDNPTSNAGYTLISITNGNSCTRTSSFGNAGANLIVRPIPTASIGGTATVCVGSSSPNITFTNPQTVAVTVTYTINGGSNQTINIAAGSSANVPVSTVASGSFVYSLVSVVYQSTPACSNTLSGSATVTVIAPLSGVSITSTASQTICSTGSGSLLTVAETGGGTITHQWGKRSVSGGAITPISSATGSTYTPTGSDLDVGTWYLICTSTPICGSAVTSNEVIVTVNPITLAAPILSDVTLSCNQTTATQMWTAISGISNYRFDVSTDSSFGTYLTGYQNLSVSSAVTSLVINGLSSGVTYHVRARTENACVTSPNSTTVTITVNSSPVKPVAISTQPTCAVSTGTITVTSPTGAGLSYSIDGSDYSNTSGTFNNVPAGDYYVTVKNASGCISVASDKVSLIVVGTTTWNGSSWDNGFPDSSKRAVFAGDITITSQLEACSCQINSGVKVGIGVSGGSNANAILKLENGLDVLGTGTLTFENNASLIQVNDAAMNTGKIIYKRVTAPMKNFDYTYWSSPVVGQKLYDLSPNTLWDKYFSYENSNWKVYPYGVGTMDPGKGYIIRVPKPNSIYPNGNDNWTGSTYAQPVQFIGVPNNGSITIATQGVGKNNLIGNPYPSAMDADSFIYDNASVIDGALYFWTHNTAITQSGSFYVYSSNDYATYTLTGGTGASIAVGAPTGKIAAGQSFFVRSKASGDFVFNNSMRNLAGGSNSQFFRISETKKVTGKIEKNRVWLNLSNSDGAFKQMLVGYITGATNEMDNLYDGISYDGNTYVDFYSVNKEKKLTIQGRALPFDKTDKVPLGYRSTIDGTFKISIDKVDGVLANQSVFIEDNVTKTLHNLKNGPYSFTTAKGTFNDRFVLVYVDKNAVVASPVVDNPPLIVEQPVTVESAVVVDSKVAVDSSIVVKLPEVEASVVEQPVVVEPIVVVDSTETVDPSIAVKLPEVEASVVEQPVVVEPKVVVDFTEAVDPSVVVNSPEVEASVVEQPVVVEPTVVVDFTEAVDPSVVVNSPEVEASVVEQPVVVEPKVVVDFTEAVDPSVVVNSPVVDVSVVEQPVVVEPTVVVDSKVAVDLSEVVDTSVVVDEPVVVHSPITVDPPVDIDTLITVDSPVVVNPSVVVEPSVTADLPVVVNSPAAVDAQVAVDPTIDKPIDDSKNKGLVVFVKNRQVKISSFDQIMQSVMVYDLRGRQLFESNSVRSNEFEINSLNSSNQFLIVMVQLANGKWVTKEVIFKN
ncbi:T9SS sorting signal type C domain-containing protein [Flavobacterium aquiphilum]|uniref:T9SS sorting signal type C domain-containing protein n=1 Tax=Flavobacterium aquiphilum TaxID=3003261 RepID=UPI0024806522|nr:T9SS sorting signal type C domain-containing protein [Flavobacterium aquiphilum]